MLPEGRQVAKPIDTPSLQEWDVFQEWTAAEGWRVPERELILYRQELADSAFVLRGEQRQPLGFVTVCRQQESAWIGNLIVDPECRGQGFGRRLFEHAVSLLSDRGIATLWLTASPEGAPLYASCGFREAGRIERWIWRNGGLPPSGTSAAGHGKLFSLVRADAAAWGHSRAELLTLLARGGQIFVSGSTVALLQAGSRLRVLGPWLSSNLCPRANREILSRVLGVLDGGEEVAIDVIGGSPVRLLLHAAGFRQVGETELMLRGETGKARFGEVVALASLGSMG